MSIFIIEEIEINYNRDVNLAKKLIKAAKKNRKKLAPIKKTI